jgi:hypothetical protein
MQQDRVILDLSFKQASVIVKRLQSTVNMFKAMDKDNTLFTPDFDSVFENVLVHARSGCVSDPPDENLYTERTMPNGDVVTLTSARVCCWSLVAEAARATVASGIFEPIILNGWNSAFDVLCNF